MKTVVFPRRFYWSRSGDRLLRASLQPAHGQLGSGQSSQHPVSVRLQLLRALLLLQTNCLPRSEGGLFRSKMQQVQLCRAQPGAPAFSHERLLLPPPRHLVAVRRGGERRDAPVGPGDGVPLHAPDRGVPLAQASRHGSGALPGPGAHLGDPPVFRQGLPGDLRLGRRVELHLKVLRCFPLFQGGGEFSAWTVCADGERETSQ